MTLLLNEIHILGGLQNSFVICAADRRITNYAGGYETRQKLFKIDYIRGAVSFFGLAWFLDTKGRKKYISDFLPDFIAKNSTAKNVKDFGEKLRIALHAFVPSALLAKHPSGFHICGYDDHHRPDFYYLTNIGKVENFEYKNLKDNYHRLTSDFLERDARKEGWDGVDSRSIKNVVRIYRNGDFRAHAMASKKIDETMESLFTFSDFKEPKSVEDYGKYIRFKFDVIAFIYKRWAKIEGIGTPIDVLLLDGKTIKKYLARLRPHFGSCL